jgi:hypothetical protein
MRSFATHSRLLLLALLLASGCPFADEGGVDLDRAILLNDAADSVLATMADAVDSGKLQVDEDQAAALVAPEPGATVARDTPQQFAWSLPSGGSLRARGSKTSGEFVWLELSGGGLARNVDVLATGMSSWTPTAAEWAEISAATGEITVTLTNATLENGVIVAGPFRRTSPGSFSIAP